MTRFFAAPDKISDGKIIIDTADVRHIKKVLRLGVGDEITVSDSLGIDYLCSISDITEESIICRITDSKKNNTEPNIKVTLYQALPKGAKMDYIIQKTTELGIARIVPCSLTRCVVKTDEKDAEKKRLRWQKIADEAAKQCGRGVIPEVSSVISLKSAVEKMKQDDFAFAAYESEKKQSLKNILIKNKSADTISFMIGPEGGFAPEEAQYLKDSGISLITLGPRILRTETAGEAVLAMIMYELGDINVCSQY